MDSPYSHNSTYDQRRWRLSAWKTCLHEGTTGCPFYSAISILHLSRHVLETWQVTIAEEGADFEKEALRPTF